MVTTTTHGVVRVMADGPVTIDGTETTVTYVIPPREITIEGPEDMVVTYCDPIEWCSLRELHEIRAHLSVSTAAKTAQGLVKAIRRHVKEQVGQ